MIQSIVEQKAFQRGNEYFRENRVRLLEANETDIAATVRGNSGVYEQTLRLREGNLVTVCSCSLIEQPMCRHCVAVLLEYNRWSSQRSKREVRDVHGPREAHAGAHAEPRAKEALPNGKSVAKPDSDVRLSEVIAFVEWAQPAMSALARNESLPEVPHMPSGTVSEWVQTIAMMDRRRREHEEVHQALHTDLAQRDLQLQQLRDQLKVGQGELGQARETCKKLEQEVAGYKTVLSKLADLSKSLGRFDTEIKSVAGDLSKGQGQLEHLSQSFRDVALALQELAKPRST